MVSRLIYLNPALISPGSWGRNDGYRISDLSYCHGMVVRRNWSRKHSKRSRYSGYKRVSPQSWCEICPGFMCHGFFPSYSVSRWKVDGEDKTNLFSLTARNTFYPKHLDPEKRSGFIVRGIVRVKTSRFVFINAGLTVRISRPGTDRDPTSRRLALGPAARRGCATATATWREASESRNRNW